MPRKLALIGASGAGKSTCLQELGQDPATCEMDRGLDTSSPQSMQKMLDWIRQCPAPVVAVSVHRVGLTEMVHCKAKGDLQSFEQIIFVYLRATGNVLKKRLEQQADERSAANIEGTLREWQAMDPVFRQLADHVIETDQLTPAQVATRVRALTDERL